MNGSHDRRRGDKSRFRLGDRRKSDHAIFQLVAVIVIFSLVSTVFILKIAAVRDDIKTLAVQQVAADAATVSAINFVACKGSQATAVCRAGITTCPGLTSLLALPAGFTITGDATLLTTGAVAICTVNDADVPPHTATFKAFGT